ncbi:MAG: quinol:cytochrome C oxidoreductase [Chitinophagales bacterium]|nr:quinol:cytochrome C oxidoreductase [Chitinophagales bacterium]
MKEQFQFTDKAKLVCYIMMGTGILGVIISLFYGANQHSRLWSNILLNSYYFTGIALGGLFFAAAHQVGYAGWHTLIKRLMTSFSTYIPYMFGFIVLIIIFLFLGKTNLYHHWVHPAADDLIVAEKLPFLRLDFFTLRIFVYFGLWIFFMWWFRRVEIQQDSDGSLSQYQKIKKVAAIFLVVFAVTSSMVSWDLIMSLDPHWYSTLFGWYNFASYMVACLGFMILFIIYLKSKGYLKQVNDNHIHDLGKYMFGFSVFYTYLWFSQYLLIWYGNIPEDTAYYIKRFDVPFFKALFFITLAINFVVPLLVLMTRKSKRTYNTIAFMSVLLIVGHYMDFYLMVMPEPNAAAAHHGGHDDHAMMNSNETVLYAEASGDQTEDHMQADDQEHGNAHSADTHGHHGESAHGHGDKRQTYAALGLIELFIFIGFAGGFIFTVLNNLQKASLIPVNDPYLKESIKHHI